MKSGQSIINLVEQALVSFKGDQNYEDLFQDCVLMLMENPECDKKRMVFLIKNHALRVMEEYRTPVKVPYSNKYHKKLKAFTRVLSEPTAEPVEEGLHIYPDHAKDVLVRHTINNAPEDLREFLLLLLEGEGRNEVMEKLGISITTYYSLLNRSKDLFS